MATTEATSAAIKDLNNLAAANSSSILVIRNSIEQFGRAMDELDHIIKSGNGDSLVTQMRLAQQDITGLRRDIADLRDEADDLTENIRNELSAISKSVRALEDGANNSNGGAKMIILVAALIGWLVPTVLSALAFFK